jgi:oligopeptide transport system substrate-binding protein
MSADQIFDFAHRHKTLVANIAKTDFRNLSLRIEPQRITDASAQFICSLLYDTLTKTLSDGKTALSQAKSVKITQNGTVYTFHLRDNCWSDGTPVTAHDFENTWKHLLDKDIECPNAYFFFFIRGARKAKQGILSLNDVGIKAIAENILRIELEKPIPFFLELLSCYVFAPLHPSSIKGFFPNSDSTYYPLISNGPFKLCHWSPNVELVMDKNPHFYRAKQIFLERVRVNYLVNDLRVIDHFVQRNIDLLLKRYRLVLKHKTIKHLVNSDEFLSDQLADTCCCVFNTTNPVLKNKKLRKALSLGIERPKILHRLTMMGEQSAGGLLPPMYRKQYSAEAFSKFQLLKARELFQEACIESNISKKQLANHLSLVFPHSEFYYNLAEELKECWEFIFDVKVTTNPMTLDAMVKEMSHGKFSMAILTWHAYYHHPISLLERFRKKSNPKNYCRWNTKEFVRLLDLAASAKTNEESWDFCQQADDIIKEEAPLAPIFHGCYGTLVQPYIKNFKVSPLGDINFDEIQFDQEMLKTRPFPEHQHAKDLVDMLKQTVSDPIKQMQWYGVKFSSPYVDYLSSTRFSDS